MLPGMRTSSEKDEKFFIDQPFDFKENPTWRIFRIMAEFTEGFEFLAPLRKEVTIFGSARLNNKDRWYHQAEKLGRLLGENGYTVITGGGPGIMEAGNKGATESGGESIGLDIELSMEQRRNKWVKKGIGFHYFFTRKMMLSASAQAYIFFPGGFGTLDEFFELVTLIQTNKMEKVAMVCVGKDYWEPLMSWIRIQLAEKYKTISLEDMDIFRLVDTADEAFEIIKTTKERKYF